MTVVLDLLRNVRDHADGIAIIDGNLTLTWADLFNLAQRCGSWLTSQGIARGDRLVYAGCPDHRMAIWFWAALRQGIVFVPLHDGLVTEQVSYVATNCQARTVVVEPHNGRPEVSPGSRVLTVDEAWREALACEPDHAFTSQLPNPNDLALLIYTSGTTGKPKGVVCPHRQVNAATASINSQLRYRSDDVILCRLPLAFDYGLYQLLLAAQVGCAVVLAQRATDFSLLDIVVRHGVSVIPLVPVLAQMLIMLQRRHPMRTSVRLFTNTGARMNPATMGALLRLFPDSQYASMYGMTECKRISILPPEEYAKHPRSVGRALPGLTITIEDGAGHVLPPGAEGEIVVRGTTVMQGYWGIPMSDDGRFRRDAGGVVLHTGDRGQLDEDGRLYFSGRDDDVIKRHGMRISLHEIEDAADQCPGVETAVALRPRAEEDPLVLVYVGSAEELDVLRHLRSHLDSARQPSSVRSLQSFPVSRNGKPDRTAIAELITTHPAAPKEISHAAV